MKVLLWTIFIICLLNTLALIINLLFSNTILAGITVTATFLSLVWLMKKGLEL